MENGPAIVLETSNIYMEDKLYPLIGVIVDRNLDKQRNASVTDVFVRYVELLRPVYCSNGTIQYSGDDEYVLKMETANFKECRIEVLAE